MGKPGLTLLGPITHTPPLPIVRAARDLARVRSVLSFTKGMGRGRGGVKVRILVPPYYSKTGKSKSLKI